MDDVDEHVDPIHGEQAQLMRPAQEGRGAGAGDDIDGHRRLVQRTPVQVELSLLGKGPDRGGIQHDVRAVGNLERSAPGQDLRREPRRHAKAPQGLRHRLAFRDIARRDGDGGGPLPRDLRPDAARRAARPENEEAFARDLHLLADGIADRDPVRVFPTARRSGPSKVTKLTAPTPWLDSRISSQCGTMAIL